ncbi:DUF1569 domain-containing protein [Mucilaginibacter sp.]|uniref:DUF1569 domain-containing protein n=1 Tax=Mucilaginibacter sp. TaxID=1882438 RepID=UPI002603ABFE|nr:DUF1569 domain-containing protein [Mucilaginibacter sp.]MDB4926659.1 hypothetical protein [Mucilaginibacter sp.]
MKTIFDNATRDELVGRIKTLNESRTPEWGQMNIYQMLKHCILADEMYLGKKNYKRMFLGRLLGKMALKNLTKDETPMGKNAPTSADFKVSEKNGDIASEKKKWIALIEEYAHFSNPDFVHWFFGKMTKEQIGCLVYKHADHHLRQFNS